MAEPALRYPFAWPSAIDQPKELTDLHQDAIVTVRLPSGDTALLATRYEDVRALLASPVVSKNRNRPDVARMTDTPRVRHFQRQVEMDPPHHTRMRHLIAKAFTAARVERFRPRIQQITDELLDAMAAAGPPADLNRMFSYPLTIRTICELIGVPADEQSRFHDTGAPPWDYMAELIERKRAEPADDLISALIRVRDEDDGRLSDHELHWWSTVLLLAGYETTASQLTGSMVLLLSHPGELARVRADYGLINSAVEELLRCQVVGASLTMLRYVTEDIEVGGVTIPKGSSIIPSLESANQDPSVYGCPMRLDIAREDRQQLTFSTGRHFCVGAPLARAELQIAIESLLRRFPELRLAVGHDELPRQDDVFFQGFTQAPVAW
jgi:cytochrome P450